MLDGASEIESFLFLLNENVSSRNMAVNKACVVKFHTLLEQNKLFGFLHAEDLTNKGKPKGLAVAFLVAAVFPVISKGFRRFLSI